MPSFKHKTNKKIVLDEKSIITLDSKHKEIEKEFEKEKHDIIPDLRAKKRYFTKLLETNLPIEQQLEIKDKLLEISSQIKELKINKKKYYLNNNKYIFDYLKPKNLFLWTTTKLNY